MDKHHQLNPHQLVPLEEEHAFAKHACNSRVYFSDEHPDQDVWLKQLFLLCGVVRQTLFDVEKQEVVYEIHLAVNSRRLYIYEKDLFIKCRESEILCPWGTIESTMQDGLMVKVDKDLEPEMLLDEVIRVLELSAINYMQQKRKIHVLLKTAKSVVRVSYDAQPEYRIFSKRASYIEAARALVV